MLLWFSVYLRVSHWGTTDRRKGGLMTHNPEWQTGEGPPLVAWSPEHVRDGYPSDVPLLTFQVKVVCAFLLWLKKNHLLAGPEGFFGSCRLLSFCPPRRSLLQLCLLLCLLLLFNLSQIPVFCQAFLCPLLVFLPTGRGRKLLVWLLLTQWLLCHQWREFVLGRGVWKQGVFVSCGGCDRLAQAWWLKRTYIYYLLVLEVRSPDLLSLS